MENKVTYGAWTAPNSRLDESFPYPFSSRFFNSFAWQLFKDALGLLGVVTICLSVLFLGAIL